MIVQINHVHLLYTMLKTFKTVYFGIMKMLEIFKIYILIYNKRFTSAESSQMNCTYCLSILHERFLKKTKLIQKNFSFPFVSLNEKYEFSWKHIQILSLLRNYVLTRNFKFPILTFCNLIVLNYGISNVYHQI